jgi:hypothetical protein
MAKKIMSATIIGCAAILSRTDFKEGGEGFKYHLLGVTSELHPKVVFKPILRYRAAGEGFPAEVTAHDGRAYLIAVEYLSKDLTYFFNEDFTQVPGLAEVLEERVEGLGTPKWSTLTAAPLQGFYQGRAKVRKQEDNSLMSLSKPNFLPRDFQYMSIQHVRYQEKYLTGSLWAENLVKFDPTGLSARGGASVATIAVIDPTRPPENDNIPLLVYYGISLCNPSDNFCRRIGSLLAKESCGGALESLDPNFKDHKEVIKALEKKYDVHSKSRPENNLTPGVLAGGVKVIEDTLLLPLLDLGPQSSVGILASSNSGAGVISMDLSAGLSGVTIYPEVGVISLPSKFAKDLSYLILHNAFYGVESLIRGSGDEEGMGVRNSLYLASVVSASIVLEEESDNKTRGQEKGNQVGLEVESILKETDTISESDPTTPQ